MSQWLVALYTLVHRLGYCSGTVYGVSEQQQQHFCIDQ